MSKMVTILPTRRTQKLINFDNQRSSYLNELQMKCSLLSLSLSCFFLYLHLDFFFLFSVFFAPSLPLSIAFFLSLCLSVYLFTLVNSLFGCQVQKRADCLWGKNPPFFSLISQEQPTTVFQMDAPLCRGLQNPLQKLFQRHQCADEVCCRPKVGIGILE